LREAGAPVPRSPAEVLRDLADAMTMMAVRYPSRPASAWARPPAGKAVSIRKGRAGSIHLRHRHLRCALDLPKGPLWPDRASGKRPRIWHCELALLAKLYFGANPGAGASRDGPAVRFFQLALRRVGLGDHDEGAIEQALTRAVKGS
jgi:hypothetical protein